MPTLLEAFVSLGFNFLGYAWSVITVSCVLGLVYLLLGHRFRTPAHDTVNRLVIGIMAATLVFAVLYVPATIYAASIDRYYGFALYAFLLTMSLPCLVSIIGLAITHFSRYPLPRRTRVTSSS